MSYRDPSLPVDARVRDLLSRMTLEEKTAQLGSVFASELFDGDAIEAAALAKYAGHGVGQITRLAGRTSLCRRDAAAAANELQRHLVDETRLGIPAIVHEECLSGYMAVDGTIFPQTLGLAASWRPDLVRRVGAVIATQMRLAGAHFGLSPVLDIARDPRWGRVEETFGEDPFLTSALGLAMVEGLQHDGGSTGVVATAKHFVGHGVPEGGRNAATPHIPPRELAEVFLSPFEQVVRHGGVGAVMHAYHDLDGVPCIANRELLTELLRDEWGFEGTVVSDYNGVEELHSAHRIAADLDDAAAISLTAGLDVELPETSGFGDPLRRAVRSGRLAESVVDRAVTRVLTQKISLGLFEHPFVEPARVHDADGDARRVAADAAASSMVLLKNENELLPLASGLRVALIGPHGSDPRSLVGDYAHVVHQELLDEQRRSADSFDRPVPDGLHLVTELAGVDSIHDAMRAAGLAVESATGCGVADADRSGFAAAIEVAQRSDVAVVVLGDRSGLTPECTTGESRDRVDIALPGVQQELLEAVSATGTPTVLVLLSGRPNALPWAAAHVPAILWAVLPGEAGAGAIVDALVGNSEPQGRLPITVARHVGQVPIHYNHNPSSGRSRWRNDYVDEEHRPLWPFGHGLGYTTFDLDTTGPTSTATDADLITLNVRVVNRGRRRGATIVQVYAEQAAASVVRPAQRLVAFHRAVLDPGESVDVDLTVPIGRLALIDRHFERVVEPGLVDLAVGFSCADIRRRVTVEVVGEPRAVPVPPPAR